MVLNVHRNHKAYQGQGEGEGSRAEAKQANTEGESDPPLGVTTSLLREPPTDERQTRTHHETDGADHNAPPKPNNLLV